MICHAPSPILLLEEVELSTVYRDYGIDAKFVCFFFDLHGLSVCYSNWGQLTNHFSHLMHTSSNRRKDKCYIRQ